MARGSIQKPKLIKGAKTANLSSPPTNSSYQPANFDFPTLNNDGSLSDLIETHPPPGQRTPPAALSSLGLKMAADSDSDIMNELNDGQYDMVDDVSDSNETVSIASDNLTSDDDEMMTPDYEDEGEDDEVNDPNLGLFASNQHPAAGPSAGPLHQQLLMLDQQHRQKLRQARERSKLAIQKEYESEKERTLDSFLSEDLETPRQSTVNAFDPSSSINTLGSHPSGTKSSSGAAGDKHGSSSTQTPVGSTPDRSLLARLFVGSLLANIKSSIVIIALIAVLQLFAQSTFPNGPVDLPARRDALSSGLVKLTNSTNATKSFNIEHLLPAPTTLPSTNIFRQAETGTSEVHFQGALPNYIVVSLPRKAGRSPQIVSTSVLKGDKPVAFNQTELIDGIYAITLDPNDAYGIVTVEMPCKKPEMNITVSHNFGRRYLQLPTLEKAISRTVAKDIERARSITNHLTAGLVATHNVSTQLAHQVGHEAQALANRTASSLVKWFSACGTLAVDVGKEIVAVQEGLARAETQVDDLVADMAGKVKRSVMEPLSVAQDRAGRIRAKYFGNEAAREKVCKRDVLVKDKTPALFAAGPKCEGKQHSCRCNKKTTKTGELVEKKTCGSCDSTKKFLGPKGLAKKQIKKAIAGHGNDAQ